MLRKAGLFGIIITGKSKIKCGIKINNDLVRIIDAEDLAFQDNDRLYNLMNADGSVLSAGPAAENGVLFSNITADGYFAAGRNGPGLVMAEKNLKYITIKGTGEIPVYDKALLKKAREDILRLISSSPVLMGSSFYGISTGF